MFRDLWKENGFVKPLWMWIVSYCISLVFQYELAATENSRALRTTTQVKK